jgi:hypothetical protein
VVQASRTQDTATLRAVGLAAYNLSYARFCELLGEPDGSYARDKYADLKALGHALARFQDSTLLTLATDYLPVAQRIARRTNEANRAEPIGCAQCAADRATGAFSIHHHPTSEVSR